VLTFSLSIHCLKSSAPVAEAAEAATATRGCSSDRQHLAGGVETVNVPDIAAQRR